MELLCEMKFIRHRYYTVPFWPRRRILPSKEAGSPVGISYFSVTLRSVLDGYEEMSMLKAYSASGHYWGTWEGTCIPGFSTCCPLVRRVCCDVPPFSRNRRPLRLRVAANRG